ncbi:hypothetical protein BCV70DRAFT_41183 [Testicularia cyperi]|uniref:Uncharacterized protein n=1 Tax=Testicularia cyperi TaxID=1882483 RepID=A0A317XL09_9BASI|nr:hypothetical protein BCV70DRAFT_41183 [Testicularia cyperi]
MASAGIQKMTVTVPRQALLSLQGHCALSPDNGTHGLTPAMHGVGSTTAGFCNLCLITINATMPLGLTFAPVGAMKESAAAQSRHRWPRGQQVVLGVSASEEVKWHHCVKAGKEVRSSFRLQSFTLLAVVGPGHCKRLVVDILAVLGHRPTPCSTGTVPVGWCLICLIP